MIKRTADMTCLLCGIAKATQKNSHYVPASLLTSNAGKRDYEETYSVTTYEDSDPYSTYYGRSHLGNTNTEIVANHHAADFIFCPECETKLGEMESKATPILVKDVHNKQKDQNFSRGKSKHGITYKTYIRKGSKDISLLIYSLIWRLNLRNWISHEENFVTVQLSDVMREYIYKRLYNIDVEDLNLPFIVLTYDEDAEIDATKNQVMCYPPFKESYCFLINNYSVFLSQERSRLLEIEEIFNQRIIVDDELINDQNVHGRFSLVSQDEWVKMTLHITATSAEIFKLNYINKLSKIKNQSPDKSRIELKERADKIEQDTRQRYTLCYIQAFNELSQV